MGHVRYLVFYLLCGMAANALEIIAAASSHTPGLGASGAIAGVLGAYLLLYPASRVGTLIPFTIVFIQIRLPAWVLIGGWFLIQLIDGIASLSPGAAAAQRGVAYWAHVGGFLMGMLLVWLFQQPQRAATAPGYLSQTRP